MLFLVNYGNLLNSFYPISHQLTLNQENRAFPNLWLPLYKLILSYFAHQTTKESWNRFNYSFTSLYHTWSIRKYFYVKHRESKWHEETWFLGHYIRMKFFRLIDVFSAVSFYKRVLKRISTNPHWFVLNQREGRLPNSFNAIRK